MADSIDFSEEKLFNNEWMDLDTEVNVSNARKYEYWPDQSDVGISYDMFDDDDEPSDMPNHDERAERSAEERMRRRLSELKTQMREGILNRYLEMFALDLDSEIEDLIEQMEDDILDECSENYTEDVERRFTWHKPAGWMNESFLRIREAAQDMADLLVGNCPASHELENAIDALDMAVMWANAAIARSGKTRSEL